MWASDWQFGLPLAVATIVFHVAAFLLITRALVPEVVSLRNGHYRFIGAVGLLAVAAALLHGLEGLAWAKLYVWLGALPDFKTAVLYSFGAMTSYGHADIYLERQWMLLGTIEVINGLIVFGLTTAFFFAAIQRAWPPRG
jgi:hypothetical protein